MKKYRMYKGRLMHVNQIAALSRKTTVRNCTIPQSGKKYYRSPWNSPVYYPGGMEIDTRGILYEVSDTPDELGLHYHVVEAPTWEHKKYPQPKNLRKKYKKKYYNKGSHDIRKIVEHSSDFPVYICKKMNHVEYMEKLVEHKLAKWERKHPKPMDMFTEEVEKWNQERETAKERLRDFVVSIYDKLPLIGRFKNKTTAVSAEYTEEKVAELKDINGDGHRVNEMSDDAPLLKKAKKVTNQVKAKRANLVATNLKDHKRTKGRIILPESELRKAA